MNESKPFSAAAERNRNAILEAISEELVPGDRVFEFGSGTGQHVCHFAAALPQITWQPSDLPERLSGIEQWIAESGCSNILPPVAWDLASDHPASQSVNLCYTANTLHIVSWPLVQRLFQHSAALLPENGKLCIYGPFLINGHYTSEGNRLFDQQLQSRDNKSGLRELNDLNRLARGVGFSDARVVAMPANNHFLIWAFSGSPDV